MGDACVRCHNTHKESTKIDWKIGEVGGVLEIIRPLDQDIARTRAGLRGTFILVGSVSGSLLAASGLAIWARSSRQKAVGRGSRRLAAGSEIWPPTNSQRSCNTSALCY